jgi:hypothetical protein
MQGATTALVLFFSPDAMPPRDLSEIRISSSLPSPPALFTAPPPPSPAAPESADVVGHAAAALLMAAVVVPGDDVSDDDNVSVLLAEEPRRSAQHRDLTGWGIDETEVQPRMAEEDPEHEPFAAARAAAARLINS